jgi:protein SCO1/2
MSTDNKPSRVNRVLTGVIIAVLATAAGIWAARAVLERQSAMNELDATRFPVPREIQPFELIDHNNAVFDNNALKQHWSFLFFGYTHCPDVCPTTLSVLNSVAQRLQDLDEDIRFIFVSVDPERDTPEQLAQYVSFFNGDFIGVTGTPEGIEQLTKPLGILHLRVATEDGDGAGAYLMDHTASVLLFDPDGRYHAVFGPPLSADAIASDFRKMLKAY